MALLAKEDMSDMVNRILNFAALDKNQLFYDVAAIDDLTALVWHLMQVNPIDRFTNKGQELDLIGCNQIFTRPTFTIGVRNGNSLEIYLERVKCTT